MAVTFDQMIPLVMVIVVTMMVLNGTYGFSFASMSHPFFEFIPGLYGIEMMIILSAILLYFEAHWNDLGLAAIFIFFFVFIFFISP